MSVFSTYEENMMLEAKSLLRAIRIVSSRGAPLTTRIVISQCSSSSGPVLKTRYLAFVTSACLDPVKEFHQSKIYLQWICELNWPGIISLIKPAGMMNLM